MLKPIFYGLALTATMASCTEDFTDWLSPLHNGQEAAKTIAIDVKPVSAIDFKTLEGVDSVQVFSTAITATDAPVMTYLLTLNNGATPAKEVTLQASDLCKVAVADLKDAVVSLYGKAPVLRDMSAKVVSFAEVKGETFRYEGTTNLQATLVAPVIENAYYLVGEGLGWKAADALKYKFTHSTTNVYDDPVFTITVPAPTNADGTRKDFYYKVVPQSAIDASQADPVWAKVLGTDQATEDVRAEEGLKADGKALKQSAADGAKFYTITLNMMDYKLTITPLAFEEYIFIPGNHQGWSPATAPALWGKGFDGKYEGFAHLNGDFKFTKVRDWKGEYNFNDFTNLSGFAQGEGSNIKATEGDYFLQVDAVSKTLTATPLTKVGIIGNFCGWADDQEVAMTYVAAEDCYKAEGVKLDGKEFKFRFNGKWADDLNLGGAQDDLVRNGGNLTAAAGTYTIKLYMSRSKSNKMYFTLE